MSRKPIVLGRDRGPIDIDLEGVPEGGVMVDLDDKDPNNFTVIEIDDVPEKDRGRPTEVLNPVGEVTEEELRGLGVKTQERIKRMTFERETERRGREAAERTANEATEAARRLLAENERLKTASAATATALSDTMLREREASLTSARTKLAAAHDEGNGEAIAEATTEISTLTAEIAMIKAQAPRKPAPKDPGDQPADRQPAQQQQQQNRQPLEPNVASWIADNRDWFGRPGFEEKTAVAYAVHDRLVKQGVKPSTDEYTTGLDEGLKKVFADHQTSAERNNPAGAERETSRRSNTVGSGSRQQPSGDAPRTVSLTASQVKLAKTLGITPQAYAASLVKHQAQQKGSAQ